LAHAKQLDDATQFGVENLQVANDHASEDAYDGSEDADDHASKC
jgi:hypothetical protein